MDDTRILKTMGDKGGLSSEELLPVVYDELRNLAATLVRGETEGQAMQATELLHEAWLRISGKGRGMWNDRAHFFRGTALEMRRVLVDNARRKSCLKRGGTMERIGLDGIELSDSQPDDRALLVGEILQRLEDEDPDCMRIITMKFFDGLTNAEIAGNEGVAERTIERHWAFARARLLEMVRDEM